MTLDPEQIKLGTELLSKHLEELRDEKPELGDFHAAFEDYCMTKYALGSAATTHRTAGKHDCGIDFYSTKDKLYHVAQCKIPERDWLEAHPEKIRSFGPNVLNDARDALRYLIGDSKLTVNDRVRHLYSLIAADRHQEDFSLTFLLIVFGRLNDRAEDGFREVKKEYEKKNVRILLQQVDDLVDEFIVGASRATDQIQLDWRIPDSGVLHARDYCYFLVNAGDLFKAFKDYGWRLFDLNLRYEVRNSAVNGDIIDSLKHHKSRRSFHHYNNGLIVIASNYTGGAILFL
ncbi:MAG: hypothetical protein HY298_19655 [Verrucomicrobia bacterium]|nr:hypothetical protein [Verrucomicrobiota bacterium]